MGIDKFVQFRGDPAAAHHPPISPGRDFKGPITQIDVIGGALLVATGNRLELCALTQTGAQDFALQRTGRRASGSAGWGRPSFSCNTTNRLSHHPAAFYDGPMLINSLHVIKNFILIGDALHGLEFVSYSPEV